MATFSPQDTCPKCDVPMGYDVRTDEFVCLSHGRFWRNGQTFFAAAPQLAIPVVTAAARKPEAMPRVGCSPNAATNVMALLRG